MSDTKKTPSTIFSVGGRSQKAPLRVLCVEDNEADYRLIMEHLRDWEMEIKPQLSHAATLSDALELIKTDSDESRFDAILLDLSLPDSQGVATYEKVRESAPQTAIIILSGNNDRDLALSMVQQGAQDYLPKDGLTSDLLTRSILYAVKRQHSRTERDKLNERLERATVELKTAQMLLIQVEKLDSLGRIAAGVAHEVKNPLGILQMGVDYFTRKKDTLSATAETVLTNMQEAITRADRIIREMVDFSRSDEFETKPCCVNDLVERSLRMVDHEVIKRNVQLRMELTRPIPTVQADQGKIQQVLINILMNAMQAMPNGETLKVRTHWAKIEEAQRNEGLREMTQLRQGDDVVVIEVRDHGPGVSPENINRIFEPFFTTKATGEGTGLGLSVARKIIELHRGSLQVQNVINPTGLRVRIILKAHELIDPPSSMDSAPKHMLVPATQP